jgi:hypothetical protein
MNVSFGFTAGKRVFKEKCVPPADVQKTQCFRLKKNNLVNSIYCIRKVKYSADN